MSAGIERVGTFHVIEPTITIERAVNPPTGDIEIWARHAEAPQHDAKLVTVHYDYCYQDNSTIGFVAEKIVRAMMEFAG